MRKKSLFTACALCLLLAVGCSANAPQSQTSTDTSSLTQESKEAVPEQSSTTETNYESFLGDWSLKVSIDEELYLITELDTYYGSTGISIKEIKNNQVKGTIYSIPGAPSYRESNVDFEGDIVDGKLTASYKDEGWLYSGSINLTFGTNEITANITRDKSDETSLWGIPEGTFTFLRPIDTETVILSEDENNRLKTFLSAVTEEMIQPFEEGALTDEMIINFVGLNLGMGSIDGSEFGDDIKSGADIVFNESVMNSLAVRYFGTEIKESKSTDTVTYNNGYYSIPALGGVVAYPIVQMLMADKGNADRYYAIVNYMRETPEEGIYLEYQYFITMQKENENYIIKSIKKISDPMILNC
ncbi:hypothetical protein SDC9_131323 [bioreactor metagenome]|uniref:Uncharacterized protein n=1 Tax=bioreactor metagenome TaxID=1076179 RepID=A0A645D6J1_9ZZZZ